ncbi:methyltransferase [Botrytis cinerea]
MSQPTGKDTPQTTPATSDPSQQNIPQATTSSASIPPQSRGPTSPDQSTTTATTTTGNHDYTQTETVNQGIAHQSDGDQDDHVEVDTHSDADSTWDDDDASTASTSITSSMLNYTYENGRRYHAYQSGSYLLPNDEAEQQRLDLKHHVFKLILGGKLFCAPIDPNPQRILDVGTGTGLWAIECADEFASAEVTGTDLSPIQPGWVPPNCKFMIDDAENEWLFSNNRQFDLIHWRVLASSISDWPKFFSQAYTHVRPGDGLKHKSTRFFGLIDEASVKNGKMMDEVAGNQKQWMIDAGFVDVHDQVYKVPIGRWPKDKRLKEIGMYYQAQCLDAVEPISMALFTRVLGYSFEEAQVMMVGPRNDMKNPLNHVYMKFHFVYGRKPEI